MKNNNEVRHIYTMSDKKRRNTRIVMILIVLGAFLLGIIISSAAVKHTLTKQHNAEMDALKRTATVQASQTFNNGYAEK